MIKEIFLILVFLNLSATSSSSSWWSWGGEDEIKSKLNYFEESTLIIIRTAAGVYVNETKSKTLNLTKTIVVTSGNAAYIDFLHNFMCYAKRLGIKFLFAAMEKEAFDMSPNTEYIKPALMNNDGSITAKASNWRKNQFNHLTIVKLEVVYQLMKLGYDVIFFDTDIILLEDPVPYMVLPQYDYVHQINEFCPKTDFTEGNTGLYYVRSNQNTLKFYSHLVSIPRKKRVGKIDDQTIFWDSSFYTKGVKLVRVNSSKSSDVAFYANQSHRPTNKGVMITYPLDSCMFSVGSTSPSNKKIITAVLKSRHKKPIALHANFLNGHTEKKTSMIDNELWLVAKNWTCIEKSTTYFQ